VTDAASLEKPHLGPYLSVVALPNSLSIWQGSEAISTSGITRVHTKKQASRPDVNLHVSLLNFVNYFVCYI
jgi:hypothetical protein